jgi:hypothetical protein
MIAGTVSFKERRKTNFDGNVIRKKVAHVLASA